MLSRRRIILLGFPAITALVLLMLGEILFNAASNTAATERQEARRTAGMVLQRMQMHVRSAREESHQGDAARTTALSMQTQQILGDTSAILVPALQALKLEVQAKKQRRSGSLSGLLDALLASTGSGKDTPDKSGNSSPVTVISANRQAISALLPESGGSLSITDATGQPLWQTKHLQADMKLTEPVERVLRFHWQGREETWVLSLALPQPPSATDELSENIRTVIAADRMIQDFASNSGKALVLDHNGTVVASLPTDAGYDQPLRETSLGWQPVTDAPEGVNRLRYQLGGEFPGTDGFSGIVAMEITQQALVPAALAELKARPALGLTGAFIFLFTMLVTAWTLKGKEDIPAPPAVQHSAASVSLPQLIRSGKRTVPEDASVLMADFDQQDEVYVHEIKELLEDDKPRYRESNVVRLRSLYQNNDTTGLNLEGRVRSPVLRELLQRVHGRQEIPTAREEK